MAVRGAGQQPVAGARVQLIAPGGARQDLVADGAGTIRVAALAPGQYQILLWPPASGREPQSTVAVPQKRVVVVIPNTTTQLVLALPGDGPQVAPDVEYDRRHQAMPYGAPPARRRMV